MYLSAQRVRSPRGARGINIAIYRHGGADFSAESWALPAAELLRRVTEEQPGKRWIERVDVAPGGNSVESFLDLVAPDDTPADALDQAIAALRPQAVASTRAHGRFGEVTAAFAVNLGELDIASVFDEIAGAALALYRQPTLPAWHALEPLVIAVTHDDDGWSFALEAQSAERVRAASGQPARAHVRYEVADAFRQVHGKLYPWVGQWVTNLSREQLLVLGGTRIVADGKIVDEWPKRAH